MSTQLIHSRRVNKKRTNISVAVFIIYTHSLPKRSTSTHTYVHIDNHSPTHAHVSVFATSDKFLNIVPKITPNARGIENVYARQAVGGGRWEKAATSGCRKPPSRDTPEDLLLFHLKLSGRGNIHIFPVTLQHLTMGASILMHLFSPCRNFRNNSETTNLWQNTSSSPSSE